MENHLTILADVIKQNTSSKRFVLGIDGLSRSGKTTLTSKIQRYLDETGIRHVVFHIDDHIVERKRRYDTGQEQWQEYYFKQWEIEWLRDNFFLKLREADHLALPYYDSELDLQHISEVDMTGISTCIIEGVFLQRREWREFFDFIVYLDTPKDKRMERESAETQLNLQKLENRYWKAEDFYLQEERPIERADLILNG